MIRNLVILTLTIIIIALVIFLFNQQKEDNNHIKQRNDVIYDLLDFSNMALRKDVDSVLSKTKDNYKVLAKSKNKILLNNSNNITEYGTYELIIDSNNYIQKIYYWKP